MYDMIKKLNSMIVPLYFFWLDDLNYQEIADILGINAKKQRCN